MNPADHTYSNLEVDIAAQGGILLEPLPSTEKELVPTAEEEALFPVEKEVGTHRLGGICGFRPRAFWTFATFFVLVIIGAAIGAGLGATRSSIQNDQPANATNDANSNGFLSTTHLATFNHTVNTTEYSSVFFQGKDSTVYHSRWNSSDKTWSTKPAVKDLSIKLGTPISASPWKRTEQNTFDYFLSVVNSTNQVLIYRASGLGDDMSWNTVYVNEQPADDASPLSLYTYPEGGYCSDGFVLWQGENGKLRYNGMDDGEWQYSREESLGLPSIPNKNSSFAIAPVYNYAEQNNASFRVYSYSNGLYESAMECSGAGAKVSKSPKELNVDDSSKMSPTASITAFTYGWHSEGRAKRPEGIHVLFTRPGSQGVSLKAYGESHWSDLELNYEPFRDVAGYSNIAANQAGKVYGVEDNKGHPQLVEWEFDIGSKIYTRKGPVNIES